MILITNSLYVDRIEHYSLRTLLMVILAVRSGAKFMTPCMRLDVAVVHIQRILPVPANEPERHSKWDKGSRCEGACTDQMELLKRETKTQCYLFSNV